MKSQTNTTEHPDEVIQQIIPAPGWYARYEDDEEIEPLVAWGLTRGGEVIGLCADNAGLIDCPAEISNFRDYIFHPVSGCRSAVDTPETQPDEHGGEGDGGDKGHNAGHESTT